LPFLLGEKDAHNQFVGHGRSQGQDTSVVSVRYRGGTRPVGQSFKAFLGLRSHRLLRVDYDRTDTPGSHYTMELDRYSLVQGIWFPFRRRTRRKDSVFIKEETIQGIRINQGLPPAMFANPVRAPERPTGVRSRHRHEE
jgi:hypothetical protein